MKISNVVSKYKKIECGGVGDFEVIFGICICCGFRI